MDTRPPAVSDQTTGPDLRVEPSPGTPRRARRNLRDRIVGGLILAMPFLITLWVIGWIYSFLEVKVIDPLAGFLLWKLKWTTSRTELPYWLENIAAPLLAIVLSLGLLYVVDLLADTRLRRAVGWALRRVPVISYVYNPVQQVFESLEGQPEQQRPQRMVLIPFPHPGVKLPAFVTGVCQDIATGRRLLAVYVPTTPVPTSGFFLLVPEDDVTDLNWSTEQALQAVMSGGLTSPQTVSYFKGQARLDPPDAFGPGDASRARQDG
jgi:uncharacterized membrane protein